MGSSGWFTELVKVLRDMSVNGWMLKSSIRIDGLSGHAQCERPSSPHLLIHYSPSYIKAQRRGGFFLLSFEAYRLPSPQLLALRLKWGFSLVAQAHCLLMGK